MSKTLTIELTFGKAVDLVETLKGVYASDDYYVERTLKGEIADLKENNYVLSQAESTVAKRAKVAALITTITGEPYGDATEADRIALIRKAVDAYVPQPELEPVDA